MREENSQANEPTREIYCPVSKHKIHSSLLEGTEVSRLPEERRDDFCVLDFVYPVRNTKVLTGKDKISNGVKNV